MNKTTKFFSIFIILTIISSCSTTKSTSDAVVYYDKSNNLNLSINLTNGSGFNHPTYVIWAEDMEGNFVRTIFITKSYASGIYGYRMNSDSSWTSERGESYQPAALPYWTYKKGFIEGKYLIPSPEHPYVDAYSGATPKADFKFETTKENNKKSYRILLEVNQPWDWNKYWNNGKYTDSEAYKHSAQPSVIYSVTINKSDTTFYMNPIGHGDPKGESGKLFTDISTLTTAKNIFKELRIDLIK